MKSVTVPGEGREEVPFDEIVAVTCRCGDDVAVQPTGGDSDGVQFSCPSCGWRATFSGAAEE